MTNSGDGMGWRRQRAEAIQHLISYGKKIGPSTNGYFKNGNKHAANIGPKIKGRRVCVICMKNTVCSGNHAPREDRICEECKNK